MKLQTENESTMILWIGNQLPLEPGKRFNLLYIKGKKGWDCACPWCSCWQCTILFPLHPVIIIFPT